RTHSAGSQRNPTRSPSFSSGLGGSAGRRAARNRARGNGRPSCCCDQTSPVRKDAGIHIAKRSRRAADVSGNTGYAQVNCELSVVVLPLRGNEMGVMLAVSISMKNKQENSVKYSRANV